MLIVTHFRENVVKTHLWCFPSARILTRNIGFEYALKVAIESPSEKKFLRVQTWHNAYKLSIISTVQEPLMEKALIPFDLNKETIECENKHVHHRYTNSGKEFIRLVHYNDEMIGSEFAPVHHVKRITAESHTTPTRRPDSSKNGAPIGANGMDLRRYSPPYIEPPAKTSGRNNTTIT